MKKSYYKCPIGWKQKIIDLHNGFCYNQWVNPNWWVHDSPTSTDYSFAYGPQFNQYPNNDNIPDVSFDQREYYSLNSTRNSVAPASWFYFRPPLGWPYLNPTINSEPNQTNYTCPYGWTQYQDDNSSGKCKSEFFNYAQNKPGPLYTIYYGPKYNKWPNNNNIPSITDLLTNLPSDYGKNADFSVATPDNFYYNGKPPPWWPDLSGSVQKFISYKQSPRLVTPGLVTPGLVTPGLVTLGLVTPNVITPGLVIPNIVTPNVVTPGLVTPGLVTPGLVTPNIVRSNVVTPNVVTPNVVTSDTTLFSSEYLFIIISTILVIILLCVILI